MDIQLLLGKDLPGKMPLGYKNIIATMNMLYEKKIISKYDLNEFKEHCDNFFSKYNDEMLSNNNDLFVLFKESTGFNNMTKKFIPKVDNKTINTNKIKTNLFFYYTKRKKNKDGLRIIEDMLFDSDIKIQEFIKKLYGIFEAEPYMKNQLRVYDANYLCIAEINEKGLLEMKIDGNIYLKGFIDNLIFDENKMNISYARDIAKRITKMDNVDDIITDIRPEAYQFTIISRNKVDIEQIERERIDAFWFS